MPCLKIPHQKQIDPGWCLPACVAMITAYWQHPLSQTKIAHWLGTESFGTPSSRIQRLARRGFDIVYQTGSLADLADWLSNQVPCILFIRTGELPYWAMDTPHAIVLAGLENEQAFLFDPEMDVAPQTVSQGDLMLAWSPFDYAFATLRITA